MPFDRSRYPKDWKDITLRIKERDGWKCKFCGLRHGQLGYRTDSGQFVSATPWEAYMRGKRLVRIILTTAHLGTPHKDGTPGDKHDKMDCRDENLAALCQKCHITFDIREHVVNASRTRERKRVEAGNAQLPGVAE